MNFLPWTIVILLYLEGIVLIWKSIPKSQEYRGLLSIFWPFIVFILLMKNL